MKINKERMRKGEKDNAKKQLDLIDAQLHDFDWLQNQRKFLDVNRIIVLASYQDGMRNVMDFDSSKKGMNDQISGFYIELIRRVVE